MGMHPRWIQVDKVYAQTQRTVDRQFLFKPDPAVRNCIGTSAVRAQQRHPVKIYWLEFNNNHEQNGIAPLSDSFDDLNHLVLFKQTFHRVLARELNRYYDREGAMFSTPPRTVPCLDNPSLEQQFFYAMTNPVKDGLVDKISHWKGFPRIASWPMERTKSLRGLTEPRGIGRKRRSHCRRTQNQGALNTRRCHPLPT